MPETTPTRVLRDLVDALSQYLLQHDCGLSAFKGQPKPKDGKCPCPLCHDAREAIAKAVQFSDALQAAIEIASQHNAPPSR